MCTFYFFRERQVYGEVKRREIVRKDSFPVMVTYFLH